MEKLSSYFLDLNLKTEDPDEPHYAKPKWSKNAQTLVMYVLLASGIFARQITAFPMVNLNLENLQRNVLIASFIIGLALFPAVFRWISRRRRELDWMHVLTAFSIGFFVDLSSQLINNWTLPFLRSTVLG